MKTLTYRGIQFENTSAAIKTGDLGILGTYRGSKTAFNRAAPASKTGAQLQFKGTRYTA